jgi:hypothetical protein
MTHETTSSERHVIAQRMAGRGYRVAIGNAGFWVRNPDMTKPPFVDQHSFVSFGKAKVLFNPERRCS